MAIAYPEVLALRTSGNIRAWTARDSSLYALALGMGADPLDRDELRFLYEVDQKAMPTMAAVLVRGLSVGFADMGLDLRRAVHGEQAIVWHRPIAAAGRVVGEGRVVAIYDKGDKGAVVIIETELRDADSGEPVATVRVTSFARGDGHIGAPTEGAPAPHAMPDRAPDRTVEIATRPDLALIYRLTGDLNPVHIDPDAARRAGFARPILHGLCTYGIAARAILATYCDHAPERLHALAARFSAPVLPGETLAFDFWREGGDLSFEARVPERGVTVLKGGRAAISPAAAP